MIKLYKPAYSALFIDILMLLLSFYVVLDWLPLTTHTPHDKYAFPFFCYFLTWLLCSFILQRYNPLRRQNYFSAILKLFYTTLFVFVLYWALIYFFYKPYSGFVLLTISTGVFVVNYILLSLYFAYRFAVEYNDIDIKPYEKRTNAVVKPAVQLDEESYKNLTSTIVSLSGRSVFNFLNQHLDLLSGNTMVYLNTDPENLEMMPNFQYSTIIQLERLNFITNINKRLYIINEKLPDNGVFVCCFESKSTRKKRILHKYPIVINYLVYSLDYLLKRVMPKIFLTRSLYYLITAGKNRIFSKPEVLGRLYSSGFKVIKEKKIGKLTYIFAQRVKEPEFGQPKIYGPLIRLHRYGKNGEPFEVYKMRTMHPYSEYLQEYIYERNSLKAGGKFNKDIRVTNLGCMLRKYWLDELPMILNMLKGEMKLVGVRPLSTQYFNLYSKELQEKRIKYKPGLLPPFYADMPRTLDEIQESEMKYLNLCEEKGVFITDFRYLFRILNNILFKKARSA